MKTEALKSDFELCAKKAKYDALGIFYCSKGGSSNSNSTNKCNCPFTFSSSPDTTSNQVYYKIRIDESLILQHCNHNPELYF
ncbi:hypothetical protein M9Y10_038863 [Tritrichomonas musculus]|uniref:Uncharacterized protein n=1 Tax=Tritrichomonas musculus TaxID=1915356 RepID=A0ABR2KA81_9EUKA